MAERPRRNNHFVPVAYLSRFTHDGTRDGLLWVHDRDEGKVRRTIPKDVGFERDLYVVDGDDWFERWLADQVDAWGARLIGELLQPDSDFHVREHPRVNSKKRFRIGVYLLIQQFRVPGARDELAEIGRRAQQTREATGQLKLYDVSERRPKPATPDASLEESWLFETPVRRLLEEMRRGDFKEARTTRDWILAIPFAASVLARGLITAPLHLVEAPKGSEFITLDSPVVAVHIERGRPQLDRPPLERSAGIWSGIDAVMYFPLSPDRLLVVHPSPLDKQPTDPAAYVEQVNGLLAAAADRFLYSRQRRDDLLHVSGARIDNG